MFVAFDRSVRVSLGVVALGTPGRLYDCLDALVAHESRHDFTVVLVVNAAAPAPVAPSRPFPDGIEVAYAFGNLGWAGGIHGARSRTDAELFVWVQEDMTPEPGWLDALVDAAETHPGVGAFGSVRVDDDDEVLLTNSGAATPADEVSLWNQTDRTPEELPGEVTRYDWVTSKGVLTRTAVFDEVGGPDPRLYPLNHVDKDFCTHLRCHGWDVALVPAARLRHLGSQASPSAFRQFLVEWRDPWFNERWAASVARLAGRTSERIDHPCAEWRDLRVDPVEAAVGIEASRMLVPFARARARAEAAALEAQAAEHAAAHAITQQHADQAVRLVGELEARAEALTAARRRTVRRKNRFRRQRDQARAELAALRKARGRRVGARLRAGVRRIGRGPRG